ncbi:MAG: fibronectin type III domain-containing protein, partial [Elusimicrobia bacterium]|nr:fibronectin type III domain-containing protein [Elusimicrobiota bacterium]
GTLYRVLSSADSGFATFVTSNTYNLYLSSSGLSANTTYYFKAAGVNNNSVATAYISASSTSTLANQPTGASFSGVIAGAIQFNWTANSNPSGTLYRVLSSADSGFATFVTSNTYNLYLSSSGLSANTTYYFKAAGVNKNNIVSNYTTSMGTSTLLGYAPAFTNFTNMAETSIQFNWSANGNPGGTLYRAYSSESEDFASSVTSDTYNLYWGATGLSANTTYYFRVVGVNNNNVATAYTSTPSTSTLANIPSDTSFSGVTQYIIQFNWSANGNPGGTLYRVLSSADSGFSTYVTSDTYNLYVSSTGLEQVTAYYFKAAAKNNNGIFSSYTAPATETTLGMGEIGAPIIGEISALGFNYLEAAWELVSGATGYTLAASVNSGNPPSPIYASSATLGDLSAKVEAPALSPNTTYYLFVRTNGPGVSSSWSAYPATSTLVENAPVFTNFTNVAETSMRFSWSANGNPGGTLYRVYSSDDENFSTYVTSDTYNLYLSSSGLSANTTYYFKAAGVNNNNVETSFTVTASTASLANQPTDISFSGITASAVQFNWSANGNSDGTLYRVLSSADSGFATYITSNTYNLHLSSSGLGANTTYYFKVAGINKNNIISNYTTSAGTSTLLGYAPAFTNFTNMAETSMQFNWSANGNPGGTLYRVYSSDDEDFAISVTSDTYNLYLSATGLGSNTTYYFRVAGVNNNNVETAYADASTSTLANIPLTAVSTFSAVAVTSFTVVWDNNSNPLSLTEYNVEVSTASDFNSGVSNKVTASTAPVEGASYSFTGLTSFTDYYFRVRAINHNGIYTNYAELGSTQTLHLSAPVINSVVDVFPAAITANWFLVGGATGYTLAASVNPALPPSPIYASSATLGDISATVEEPPLGPHTIYYLFVKANGPKESSSWSVYPATATLSNPPLTVVSTFSKVGYNSFFVHWDNNSNPLTLTEYTVQVSTASNFNEGVTDQVSFTTAPAAGPMAQFTGLNHDTYYYFRVRAVNINGSFGEYVNLGYVKTLITPAVHSAGDGVVFYGQAGNSAPQFRHYYGETNSFSAVQETLTGTAGSLFVIKTSPLTTVQEIIAGYIENGTLHVLCSDGANWTEEWTQTVGGDETTRRFDIAHETNTGDVIVLYSKNASATNELGYRTKAGDSGCGSANWSADTSLDPVRTSGIAQWVKMAPDRRATSNLVAAIWADSNSDLSAMVWNGSSWENEPASALETSLEVVSVAQDIDDFDVEFESISGDIMVIWANSAGSSFVNGVRYAVAAYTGGSPNHTWGSVTIPPTFLNDATNLDLSANPNTNEMVFASIGNGGSDIQMGYWSGTAWTNDSDDDTTCQLPLAGTKLIATGWLTSGGTTRSIIAYNDSLDTDITWYVGTGGTFVKQTDAGPLPIFASPQKRYDIKQDPVNKDRLILTISDSGSDLFSKRLIMTSVPAFTWTDANGGSALETGLASSTVGGYSFAFWPSTPTSTFNQVAYRLFENTDTTDVGAPLAAQDTSGIIETAGEAFRLRTLIHVDQVDLPINGQGFKLQFAGKGSGTCAEPSQGVPAAYTDITADTIIAFKDNSPADGAALTDNENDPQYGAVTTVNQTYEELNNSTNSVSAIPLNQAGLWDFALKENGVTAGTAYCFRLTKGDGSLFNSYAVYPEMILSAPVYINEVYASSTAAAGDWVELYNNTSSTASLIGWNLYYTESTIDLGGTHN